MLLRKQRKVAVSCKGVLSFFLPQSTGVLTVPASFRTTNYRSIQCPNLQDRIDETDPRDQGQHCNSQDTLPLM